MVAEAEFQAGGGSEGWVIYAPVDPRIFFRPGAVGRGWLCGGQAHDGLQNNLQGKERIQGLLSAWHWPSPPRCQLVPRGQT